jgi:hypothetical protein
MAFYKRVLRVILAKADITSDNLSGNPTDQLTLDGLRVIVQAYERPRIFGTAQVQIYGMTPSQMAFFTRVDGDVTAAGVQITASVLAQDARGIYSLVYSGAVINALPQLNQAPDVSFSLTCQTLGGLVGLLVAPKSYNGSEDAASIFNVLATQAGLTYTNRGVTAVLSNQYLHGSWTDQLRATALAAGANFNISGTNLTTWPLDGAAPDETDTITTITPTTGLIGYPRRESVQMLFDTEYNPAIHASGFIKLDGLNDPAGLVKNCLGTWQVLECLHNLSSEAPGGPWMTSLVCGLQKGLGVS